MGGGVEEALRRLEFLGGDDQPDTPLGGDNSDTRPVKVTGSTLHC